MNSIYEVIFLVAPMGGLLLLSAFFSGTETALFSLSSEGARQLRSHRRTRALLRILQERPDQLLTAILFGNLVVNILFFCTGAAVSGRWAAERGGWFDALGAVFILLAVILFGEIVPKAVGIAHPCGVLLFSASPLNVWFSLTKPFCRSTSFLLKRLHSKASSASAGEENLTQGELRELLDAVRHEPGFGTQEKEILGDILTLPDVRAREIMVPRTQVPRRALGASRNELLQEARHRGKSRILISGEQEDDLLGFVGVSDLLLADKKFRVEPVLHPLVFVPETRRLDLLLRDFLAYDWVLAAVVDEYGGFAGTIALEDILAEVVGEFEPGGEEDVVRLGDGSYRLSGQLSVRAWRELFIGVLPEAEAAGLAFDTLGGFMISRLGRIPTPGDTVTVRNLCLTVEAVSNGRVTAVLLHLESGGLI